MLVAGLTICVGAACLYYGARSLRVWRAVRRLRSRTDGDPGHPDDGPSHPTDWLGADPVESGETLPERGSVERGVVLLALGACCVLFGILAV